MFSQSQEILRAADLRNSNLVVDQVYQGGRQGNAGDDPLGALLGVSNQGGFRYLGTRANPSLIVLTTSLSDPDWPDTIDHESGTFTYYGDNKKPGHDLHQTPRFGNLLLKQMFENAHNGPIGRQKVPPVLAFGSVGPRTYRDVRFLGLVVPGIKGVPITEDLVAVWKSTDGQRFQNYRAVFTILDVPKIDRAWLNSIRIGSHNRELEPAELGRWKKSGVAKALRAERTVDIRSKAEQLPKNRGQNTLIQAIISTFKDEPTRFEHCACRITEMMLGQGAWLKVTQPFRDGGRDAVGIHRIGRQENGIDVEFALEAKCYSETTPVSVKDLSRLISRLRHRQFGVLVTTSYVGSQAYREIKEDQHPVIVVTGRDIANILQENGLGKIGELNRWLREF